MIRRLLLGSNNPKKRKELATILAGLNMEILTPADLGSIQEPEETGETFEANAELKALYYSRAGNLPALADDSGLVVDALDGKPGVQSSRYAGEDASDADNCEKLLRALEGIEQRTARFVCVVKIAADGSILGTSKGVCEGTILTSMRGRGGFGYDPLFYFPPEGKTFAEIPEEVKNRVSHRARALRGIRPVLEKL